MTSEQLREERIARLPKGSPKGRKHVRLNALSVAKLMAALMAEPVGLTYEEMIDITGLSYTVVKEYMHALHNECCAHISQWVEDGRGGRTRKQWALGSKKDAPRPGAKCVIQRARDYRNRKRQAMILGLTNVRDLPREPA
jgi:predicted ArsR family transcriptional regulator